MKTMLFIFTTLTFINTAALIFLFIWLRNLDELHTKALNDILEIAKLFKLDSGSWRAAINIHSSQIDRLEKAMKEHKCKWYETCPDAQMEGDEEDESNGL